MVSIRRLLYMFYSIVVFNRLQSIGEKKPVVLASIGGVCTVVSAFFITLHMQTIAEIRDVSVPIVAQLPQLEQRLSALRQQVELTELHSANRSSAQEKVEVYALPRKTDLSRLIATFEITRDLLQREGLLADMSEIDIAEPEAYEGGGFVRRVTVHFSVHEEAMRTILLMTRLAGLLTVGDVLTEKEVALLVDRVEQENPSGIVALEQFLSTDLLRYIEEPRTYEEQLKRSFSTTTFFNALENVIRTSLLYEAKLLLGSDMGEVLRNYKLWPMQIMAVDSIGIVPGNAKQWYKLDLTVLVFSEES